MSELDSWEVWLSKVTLQVAQVRADAEKDKQIDFLNALVTVRDQEIAQLKQLASEWKQLVQEQQEVKLMSLTEIELWYETWEMLKKRTSEKEMEKHSCQNF